MRDPNELLYTSCMYCYSVTRYRSPGIIPPCYCCGSDLAGGLPIVAKYLTKEQLLLQTDRYYRSMGVR